MFLSPYKTLFLMSTILSSILAMTVTSWFIAWMALEINMLSFMPFMAHYSQTASEVSLKYFFSQSLGSIFLLLSIIFSLPTSYSLLQPSNFILNIIMVPSLLLKLGAAPFHLWFIQIIEGSSWMASMMLMTLQKLAPLMLLTLLLPSAIITLSAVTSVMLGAISGLNLLLIRKLLAFSSLSHLGWMIMSALASPNLALLYLSIYSLTSTLIMISFHNLNIFHISQLLFPKSHNSTVNLLISLSLLSLNGLPPFMGFIPKWMTISYFLSMNLMVIPILMLLSSLLSLIFYLRLIMSSFLLSKSFPSWSLNPSNMINPYYSLLITPTLTLPVMLLIPLL